MPTEQSVTRTDLDTAQLCRCGCGKPAPIAKSTVRGKYRKGDVLPYLMNHMHPAKEYPMRGYRFVHIALAEKALGKPLPPGAQVHHVDKDITNLHPRLVICQDDAYHKMLHVRERVLRAGGNPNTQRFCGSCKRFVLIEDMGARKGRMCGSRCKACQAATTRRRYREMRAAAESQQAVAS